MKILVLGGAGMAGHVISIYLKEQGYDVLVFARRKIEYCDYIIGDVTNFNKLKEIIRNGQFDAVINAIGILNKDAENNKANAVLINAYLPHFLSDLTKDLKTKIVHMSTDCVFSGKTGSYLESSIKDGETFYDRSKALGEIQNQKDLTFRNSIIGPDINPNGIGLFNWFMNQSNQIHGYTKAIWTGVTTLTLAKAMEAAILEDLTGLYNLVNNRSINKYELLQLFNENMKRSSIEIIPNENFVVDKSLVNSRSDFSFIVPDYKEMVIEMCEWINIHKQLYPHYFDER